MVHASGKQSDTVQSELPATHDISHSGTTDASLANKRKNPHHKSDGNFHPRNHGLSSKNIAIIVVVFCLIIGGIWFVRQRNAGGSAAQSELNIGLKLAPASLDIRQQSGTALDQVLIDNVYEPLVSKDQNNQVIPGLAKSWDISQDSQTYTFHLSTGMTFSNGHRLDASSVAWSLQQLLDHKYVGANLLRNVESISASDDSTVVIHLSQPYADLLWQLSGRPGLVFDKDASYDAKTQTVGSGPYQVTSFKENDSLTLSPNPYYQGTKKANISTINIKYFSDDNAAINALKSDSVQVLAPVMNAQLAQSLSSDQRFEVGTGQSSDKYVLAMNPKNSALSQTAVRQAIRYAIDRDAIIASRGGVDAKLGGPIPQIDPGYQDLSQDFPYDVNKAQELLKSCGYSTDNPLTLSLEYPNTYGTQFGEQLTADLKKVGINLQVSVVEFSTWLQDVYKNHHYDMSLVDQADSHDFYQWTDPNYYFGYNSAEVQKLYRQAMSAQQDQVKNDYLQQAARIVSNDSPADWLLNYRVTTAWDKNIQQFPLNMNQSHLPLWQVSYSN